MLARWAEFFPLIVPHVPGCPEVTVAQYLAESAAEFCAETRVWQYVMDPDITAANLGEYELDIPTGALLEDVVSASVDGVELKMVDGETLFRCPERRGAPTQYALYQGSSIRLYPTPDKKAPLRATLILKPSRDAAGVERFLFDDHARAIADGACYRLCAIPGKEWSNPQEAGFRRLEFYRAISQARRRNYRGSDQFVRFVGFDGATRG